MRETALNYEIIIMAIAIFALNAHASASPAITPTPVPAVVKKKPSTAPKFYGSLRIRPEDWQWFQPIAPKTSKNNYLFTGSLLKVGMNGQFTGGEYDFELAETSLFNLPKTSSLPTPIGPFGPGANYYANSAGSTSSAFLKQGYVRLWNPGDTANSIKLGRFDFNEGVETKPSDPSLNVIQQTRIQQRLIGTFSYSDIQRSFDGFQYVHNTKDVNVTAFGAMPTQGVFTLNGDNNDLGNVKVGYIALTSPQREKSVPQLGRLFFIDYEDDRPDTVKTDNRPLAVRTADTDDIRIQTIGGDYARVFPTSAGKFDILGWGADQFGHWGDQTQEAYAYDAEVGYQPPHLPLSPWLRAGYYVASGDNNPNDGVHKTFFLVLPTPRIYARLPFFTQTNLHDAFVELTLRPDAKTTIRTDLHDLSLDQSADLWYQGGGAFTTTGNFGYSGTPSGGQTQLATLADASVDYKINKRSSVSVYYGYAFPGKVIKTEYTGQAGSMEYVEFTQTF